ncbi:uncharacterized protein LOC122290930 [Carya illinoinensis]|uniref:uncharacterized protein LOC122290930 n=1 Tax=Carya illinoinensis TaxID=32201 RepID=UPI001C719271|nr:uncharacterized protein LOC122290930 [Carya illinoinensis]
MTRALNAKNKLVSVDDTLLPPETSSPNYRQWNQTKDMVLTWLLNSISPSIANSLEFHTDPRAVWLDLQSRFCQGNNARIYHLKRELSSLQQHNHSVHDYYNQIKQIWDKLSHLQPTNDLKQLQQQAEDERVYQFLLGLNESFFQLRTQILAMETLPPITKIFSILFQEEQQRLLHLLPPLTDAHILAAHSSGPTKQPLQCTFYVKMGHSHDRCWRVIGYPTGRDNRGKQRPSLLRKPPLTSAPMAHQVSTSSPLPGLTHEMYQKLLDLLQPNPSSANFMGPTVDEADWSG